MSTDDRLEALDTNSAASNSLSAADAGVPASIEAMRSADVGRAEALPIDTVTDRVLALLEQPPPRQQWWHALSIFVVSLALFGAAGLLQNNLADLAILVLVLLFHETGHYVGMRLFHYQDVRMFFIPFFGAAVSGRNTNVPGYQQAIVLLLGPLPGIILGLVLGAACLVYDHALLRGAALMLVGINVFNLLPFLPFDGGRLVQLTLFSRQRHLEAVFRVVAALVLGLISWALGAWILLAVSALLLITTPTTFRISSIVGQLKHSGFESPASASGSIPAEQALPLIGPVREAFPQITEPKGIATLVRSVMERLQWSAPGVIGSILTLLVHGGSFVLALVALALLHMPTRSVVQHVDASGNTVRREEVRVLGGLQQYTELNEQGEYHGRHEKYAPHSTRVVERGQYELDQRHGVWSTFDETGMPQSYQQYEHGELVLMPPSS